MAQMHYQDIKMASERYAHTARMHPNDFWAVLLLSAANIIDALVDQSEKRYLGSTSMIDVETDADKLFSNRTDENIDTSDIPEASESDFARAKIVMPESEPELFPHTHAGPEPSTEPTQRKRMPISGF